MIRNLLAGVAALALMAGAASAQDNSYYANTRSVTQTTPFGTSRTVTTTTSESPTVLVPQPSYDDRTAEVAELPPPASAPPPPPDYERTTTTTEYGPDGVATQRTERYQRRQTFYDGDGELSAHTTTMRSRSVTYGPAPVYVPNAAAAGPQPGIDLPPPYRHVTVTTTTTTGE